MAAGQAGIVSSPEQQSGTRGLTESELLRFVYTCPLALLLTDHAGEIRLLNGAATALLAPYADSGYLDNLYQFTARWSRPIADSMRTLGRESIGSTRIYRLQVATGAAQHSRWLELCVQPFDGGLSVTAQDVTGQVHQQEELVRSTGEESHQRGRAEMGAAILHDMGNILTGIGSQAITTQQLTSDTQVCATLGQLAGFLAEHRERLNQALGDHRGDAMIDLVRELSLAAEDVQQRVLQGSRAMAAYIAHAQELISINRTYAQNGSAGRLTADLGRILSDLAAMTEVPFHKRSGMLQVHLPALPVHLLNGRSAVMRILLNLIKNAQEAWDSSQGEPLLVTIHATCQDSGGVLIRVDDNGCGFEPGRAEELFALGFSTKERDSGQGLTECRKLAEGIGGRLTLESPGPGLGATATLYLPPEILEHGQ